MDHESRILGYEFYTNPSLSWDAQISEQKYKPEYLRSTQNSIYSLNK